MKSKTGKNKVKFGWRKISTCPILLENNQFCEIKRKPVHKMLCEKCEFFERDREGEITWIYGNYTTMKADKRTYRAFREVLMRLSLEVFDEVSDALSEGKVFVVFAEKNNCYVEPRYSVRMPEEPERCLLVIGIYTNKVPYKAIVGVIAHEFAHIYLKHYIIGELSKTTKSSVDRFKKTEKAADKLASEWGFKTEVKLHRKIFPRNYTSST